MFLSTLLHGIHYNAIFPADTKWYRYRNIDIEILIVIGCFLAKKFRLLSIINFSLNLRKLFVYRISTKAWSIFFHAGCLEASYPKGVSG
jgi:hypothetical protein